MFEPSLFCYHCYCYYSDICLDNFISLYWCCMKTWCATCVGLQVTTHWVSIAKHKMSNMELKIRYQRMWDIFVPDCRHLNNLSCFCFVLLCIITSLKLSSHFYHEFVEYWLTWYKLLVKFSMIIRDWDI